MSNSTLCYILVLFLLTSTLSAQELYLRNRPFKGAVSGQGEALLVDLQELTSALELAVKESEGITLVGDSTTEGAQSGDVVVEGQILKTTAAESGPMVNLKEFSQAAGLNYRFSREMNTVDVSLPVAKGKVGAGAYAATGGAPVVINGSTPGELVDTEALIQRGKLTMFLWYKNGETDPGYKKCFTAVDVFAESPDVVLYKVNIGHPNTPLSKKFPGMVPRLVIVGKNGRLAGQYNGHSILQAVAAPESTIKQALNRP